jgi:DNA-binding NarL/FixJ family response regulator
MKKQVVYVLIFERQPMMLVALSSTLSAGGINVIAEMQDTSRLVQTARALTPDLILYSVGDPSLEDCESISALRHATPSASILALVDSESDEQMELTKEYGATMVLTKAAPREELLDAIRQLCKMRNDTE